MRRQTIPSSNVTVKGTKSSTFTVLFDHVPIGRIESTQRGWISYDADGVLLREHQSDRNLAIVSVERAHRKRTEA